MLKLFRFILFRLFQISLILAFIVSFVASQIEILDSVERKVQNLLYVFSFSFFSYFLNFLPLSLPVSSFRFFSSNGQKIDYLQTFGLVKAKFFSLYFLHLIMVLLLFIPAFSFSEKIREKFRYAKGQFKKEFSEYVEGKGIFFYRIYDKKNGKYEYILISENGDILERGYTNFVNKPFAVLKYIFTSFIISLSSCISAYVGFSKIPFGWIYTILLVGISSMLVF